MQLPRRTSLNSTTQITSYIWDNELSSKLLIPFGSVSMEQQGPCCSWRCCSLPARAMHSSGQHPCSFQTIRSASPGCIQLPRVHSVRLRNDLYCVEWCVKLYSNQPSKRVLHNGALLTVAPAVWNSLSATLRDSGVSLHTFKRRLCSMMNTIRRCCGAFARRRYIRLLTYLLTYFLLAGGPG